MPGIQTQMECETDIAQDHKIHNKILQTIRAKHERKNLTM